MDKVTAIVLNYNSSKDCKKCVEYLKKQNYKNLNVIIVDNNSPDENEKDNIRKIGIENDCNILYNEENNGFSAGNNIGLKYAISNEADWCLIINPDIELRDENYVKLVIEESKRWNKAAIIGTNMILPSGKRQNPQREASFLEEFFWPIQLIKSKIKKNFEWYLEENKTGYCEKLCGGCFFIKSNFIKEIGYLDENVFMYSEEAILSQMVKKMNKKELYIREITAYHEHYTSEKAPSKNRMLKFIKSRKYYIDNYSEYGKIKRNMIKFSLWIEEIYTKVKK